MTLAFVTNNAARTAGAWSPTSCGTWASTPAADVVTSAQAAAREVAALVPTGSAVLVVGGEGLEAPSASEGLSRSATPADEPLAVVQGFHPDVGWRQLAEGAYAVGRGPALGGLEPRPDRPDRRGHRAR